LHQSRISFPINFLTGRHATSAPKKRRGERYRHAAGKVKTGLLLFERARAPYFRPFAAFGVSRL